MPSPVCGRQAGQEGRVQTSCGRSLQPPPALAMAFLQADVDARHREVVCTLIRLNEVPEKQRSKSTVLQDPPSRCTEASARQGRGLQAAGTHLALIPTFPWQSRVETLEPGHPAHRGALSWQICSAWLHMPILLDIPHKVTQAGLALSPRALEQAGGEPWARRHLDALGFPPLQAITQFQGSPGLGHDCSTV